MTKEFNENITDSIIITTTRINVLSKQPHKESIKWEKIGILTEDTLIIVELK
jgi:hypothetical protein